MNIFLLFAAVIISPSSLCTCLLNCDHISFRWQIHAAIGFTLVSAVGIYWKIAVMDQRKKNYLDYYNKTDLKVEFERMKKAGVFQAVNPDGSAGDLD